MDVDTLFTCPRAPPSWYQVCNNQGNPVPMALQVTVRETEELVAAVGCDLAVISELDWLTSGASHLLGQMAATPALLPFMSSITLLQHYALETCRSVEMLEWSSTAPYANHIWRLRDGHLSKLHGSVPKQTREFLRQAPLLGKHLFSEETVAIAGQNLRETHESLQFTEKNVCRTAGKKASSQPSRVKQNPPQQPPMVAGRGRGGKASRGLPKPQEDEVGGIRIRNIPNFCSPPLFGCRSHPFKPPILVQSLPPIGSRLSASSAEWAKIGADQWVLRTLSEGYSPPFSSLPPLTSPIFLAPYQNPEKRKALHLAVREMEMNGAIEVIRTPSPGFYSRLFLVPKDGGTWRPIIDLSALNTHIQCPSRWRPMGQFSKPCKKGNGSPFWIWKTLTFISLSTPPTGGTFGSATKAWFGNFELFRLG